MSSPLYIAKKYFLTKRKTGAANFINITAILGVVVGTMALFVILSTFSGLEKTAVQLLFEKKSTLKIQPKKGKKLVVSPSFLSSIRTVPGIKSMAQTIEEKVQLTYNGRSDFIYLNAIDTLYRKTNLDSIRLFGSLPSNDKQIALANHIVAELDIAMNDFKEPIKLYAPKKGKININHPQNAFNVKKVALSGIFYDNKSTAYTTLKLGQELLDLKPNEVYSLEIQHSQTISDEEIKNKIVKAIGDQYNVLTQKDQLGIFYKMMQTENLMVYLIFTLILIISTFNLIGAIIVLIIEKREDLITLHAMGMNFKQIKQIFLIEGFIVTSLGGLTGLFIGLLLIILQRQFGMIRVNSLLPYPVEITAANLFIVIGTVLIIGILASRIGTLRLTKDFLKRN